MRRLDDYDLLALVMEIAAERLLDLKQPLSTDKKQIGRLTRLTQELAAVARTGKLEDALQVVKAKTKIRNSETLKERISDGNQIET